MVNLIKTALVVGTVFWVGLGVAATLWLMATAAKIEREEKRNRANDSTARERR